MVNKIQISDVRDFSKKAAFNLDEAAAYLGVSSQTLAKGIKSGKANFKFQKLGKRYLIPRVSLDAWLVGNSNASEL
jgi:excisionase family DNA binding protein